jgi:hypothetical protein
MLACVGQSPRHMQFGRCWGTLRSRGVFHAQQTAAGDGVQRPLRSRFPPRLSRSVMHFRLRKYKEHLYGKASSQLSGSV